MSRLENGKRFHLPRKSVLNVHGKTSMVERICCKFCVQSESVNGVSGESEEEKDGLRLAWRGETGSQSEAESWFQRWGEAYWKEWLTIFRDEVVKRWWVDKQVWHQNNEYYYRLEERLVDWRWKLCKFKNIKISVTIAQTISSRAWVSGSEPTSESLMILRNFVWRYLL